MKLRASLTGEILELQKQLEKKLKDTNIELFQKNKELETALKESKSAKDNLQEQRDKAQKYLDIAGTIIVALDVNGNVDLINKKGCKILGLEEKEILGKNWLENFIPERFRESIKELHLSVMSGKKRPAEHYENLILAADGKERLIDWYNANLFNKNGKIVGSLSSGEDITESKRAQKEIIKRSEELEKMNKFMVGREIDMIELKKEVNRLLKEKGRPIKYNI